MAVPTRNTPQKTVAIIGAGVAGISAAVTLAKQNVKVHLYEASTQIGGRASEIHDTTTGEHLDNGQHLLSGAYLKFTDLLEQLGTYKYLSKPNGLSVPYIDLRNNTTSRDILDTTGLPGKLGMAIGFQKFNLLKSKDKLNIAKVALAISSRYYSQPIGKTAYQFLTEKNQTKNAIEVFWEPLILATLNTPIQEASAELLYTVCKLAFFADKKSSSLIFPLKNLNELLRPARSVLNQSNGEVFLRKKIKNIEPSSDSISIIDNENTANIYDFVISAVTANQLLKIFPDSKSFLPPIDFSPISSIYLWTDKEIIKEKFTALIGTNIQWIFNRYKIMEISSNFAKHSYSLTISASDTATNPEQKNLLNAKASEIKTLVAEELAKVNSGFTEPDIKHIRIIHEKQATFLATPDYEKARHNIPLSISNRLMIAGDWTSTGLPGTLESACRSGLRSAELILNNIRN
ncbi:MAG: hydroxysqualene dehydroxylase HpnE [Candidatus Kapaibacteriales bacterium]